MTQPHGPHRATASSHEHPASTNQLGQSPPDPLMPGGEAPQALPRSARTALRGSSTLRGRPGGRDEVVRAAGRPFVTLLLLSPAGASPSPPNTRPEVRARQLPALPAPPSASPRVPSAPVGLPGLVWGTAGRGHGGRCLWPGLVPHGATTHLNPCGQELLATQFGASRRVFAFPRGCGVYVASCSGHKFLRRGFPQMEEQMGKGSHACQPGPARRAGPALPLTTTPGG